MAGQFVVYLYSKEGGYVGEALADVDLSLAVNREYILDNDGTYYKWEQRADQWRETLGITTLSAP